MEIKAIAINDREWAMRLVERVFMQFEATDYSSLGVQTFHNTVLNNNEYLNDLAIYGAYENLNLLGVIATRNNGNHIALFFVDSNWHRQGIGRMLFREVIKNSSENEITVNASPYAVEVYHRLGFVDMQAEKTTDGMRYTPMQYSKNSNI